MENQIQTTTDYRKFKRLVGNRKVDGRAERIKKSIEENGWISNPIVVNEKMEIIDGQSRFEALAQLGLPIEYRVVNSLDINACRMLNTYSVIWKYRDFLDSYAAEGNPNYVRVKNLMDTFGVTDVHIAVQACGKCLDAHSFVNGQLEISQLEFGMGYKHLSFYSKFMKVLKRFGGRTRTKSNAFFLISETPNVDEDYLLEVLKTCDPTKIYPDTMAHFLESVQRVYNYGRGRKNRVHFYEKYLEARS